jgi:acyl-CoA thioester hydrolase
MRVENPHELLREFPVVVSLAVEWGDQDCFAHVNNTVYLKWCETARVVYLEQIGMWQLIKTKGMGPILAAASCNYRHVVTFPDTIQVGARVTKMGNSSFHMGHAIVSLAQNRVVADSDTVMVFVEYQHNRSLPVTASLRKAMEKLEGQPLTQRA